MIALATAFDENGVSHAEKYAVIANSIIHIIGYKYDFICFCFVRTILKTTF